MKIILLLITFLSGYCLYGQDVYINNFNYKYHTKDCEKVTKSYYPVPLKDALKNNYKPCKECSPPTVVNDEDGSATKNDGKHPLGYENEDAYTTSTGHVIKVGDTLRLGIGSKDNGEFAFIWKYNPAIYMGTVMADPKLYFPASYSGMQIIVSSVIKPSKEKYGDMYVLMFKIAGQLIKYRCEIESAIKRGELVIPGYDPTQPKVIIQNTFSVADEIKKMKDLLDNGVITQDEFDSQKKKLLER